MRGPQKGTRSVPSVPDGGFRVLQSIMLQEGAAGPRYAAAEKPHIAEGGQAPFLSQFITQAAVCRLSGGVCLPAGVYSREKGWEARQAGGWEFRV